MSTWIGACAILPILLAACAEPCTIDDMQSLSMPFAGVDGRIVVRTPEDAPACKAAPQFLIDQIQTFVVRSADPSLAGASFSEINKALDANTQTNINIREDGTVYSELTPGKVSLCVADRGTNHNQIPCVDAEIGPTRTVNFIVTLIPVISIAAEEDHGSLIVHIGRRTTEN